jgi:CDP-6-deoxy-D-xylo-4-hexulose-3-dehydrase
MRYFDYEIYGELINANYLHDNGFFVGNHHVCIRDNIFLMSRILNSL